MSWCVVPMSSARSRSTPSVGARTRASGRMAQRTSVSSVESTRPPSSTFRHTARGQEHDHICLVIEPVDLTRSSQPSRIGSPTTCMGRRVGRERVRQRSRWQHHRVALLSARNRSAIARTVGFDITPCGRNRASTPFGFDITPRKPDRTPKGRCALNDR